MSSLVDDEPSELLWGLELIEGLLLSHLLLLLTTAPSVTAVICISPRRRLWSEALYLGPALRVQRVLFVARNRHQDDK